MQTDDVIGALARQAGTSRGFAKGFTGVVTLASLGSVSVAAVLALAFIGLRQNLLAEHFAPFAYKLASMAALAAGSLWLLWRAALPGRGGAHFAALAPGVFVLLFRAITDPSGYSVMGNSDVSVQACVTSIVLLSMPALLLLMGAVRTGAPTRPGLTGGVTGLLAGTLGAAAYALSCKNDAGSFVLVWYTAAIAFVAALGAGVGKRALAW
jgi:hypothetical protein